MRFTAGQVERVYLAQKASNFQQGCKKGVWHRLNAATTDGTACWVYKTPLNFFSPHGGGFNPVKLFPIFSKREREPFPLSSSFPLWFSFFTSFFFLSLLFIFVRSKLSELAAISRVNVYSQTTGIFPYSFSSSHQITPNVFSGFFPLSAKFEIICHGNSFLNIRINIFYIKIISFSY